MLTEYRVEQITDFGIPVNRQRMEESLKKVRSEFGKEYPLIIGGERIYTEKKIESYNPSNPDEVVGYTGKAGREEAEKAMQVALSTFESWKNVSAEARARILFRAASIMKRRRFELNSWMVYEAGKTWIEADADTAEAIDFLEYYGREMLKLDRPTNLYRIPGEDNEQYYIPLGVGIVIPPWNFPLAILAGMTSAAVVAGNTVILKPASTTTVIAAKFMEIMEEAGLPAGVINFLPGSGGVIGDYLVEHPKTRFVAFTGSMEVGLRINELAAKPREGQIWIKRVIAEMGGKDAIVVDNEADIDAAVEGIVTSAFGFQGQKCSACSRAIIHRDVYDEVKEKVIAKVKEIRIGQPDNLENYMGPVVDESAMNTILGYMDTAKSEGTVLVGGKRVEGSKGYFLEPTVVEGVAEDSRIAQEEIFGPVLALFKAEDYDDAIRIANNSIYGLTGSVYSRNREKLEKARSEFHVGNLYFNRKSTGALVGVHPFGGFNMSGTDSKAGGPEYLLLFTQPKLVSERM